MKLSDECAMVQLELETASSFPSATFPAKMGKHLFGMVSGVMTYELAGMTQLLSILTLILEVYKSKSMSVDTWVVIAVFIDRY